MVRGKTVDVMVPANAEIVLEGELLPNGWTADEGPFGEFAGMQGDLKYNPLFRVTAITHRKNPIFYALQMPWENDWLNGPATEAACARILGLAGIPVAAVRATEGGCCGWSVVAAIKKRAGEGKNAIAALLSLPVVKQVIVTDDDINIYNSDEVEWAVTFRCQADKDIVILSGMKGKHVDPSVRPWDLGPGELPTTSKFGIDATIPEGIPAFRYERIVPAFQADIRDGGFEFIHNEWLLSDFNGAPDPLLAPESGLVEPLTGAYYFIPKQQRDVATVFRTLVTSKPAGWPAALLEPE